MTTRAPRVTAHILALLLALGLPAAKAASLHAPCTESSPTAAECDPVNVANPMPVSPVGYPIGTTPLTGNATGTTGAVVGTLAAASGKTTYICGFTVSAIGGTAAVGPITLAGLTGSSMVFQLSSSAAGVNFSQTFLPCIPASATNTAITVTTTADGTATAVDINSWGYRQ
jgi:hypothetical protein